MLDVLGISDALLLELSDRLSGWQIECIDGRIIMTPTGFKTGRRNACLTSVLYEFAEREGYLILDSSGGVRLPNGDVLSAEATLLKVERAAAVADEEGLAHIVPNVVVELASPRDRGRDDLQKKCERWASQGLKYVVLLDPFTVAQTVWGEAPARFPDLCPFCRCEGTPVRSCVDQLQTANNIAWSLTVVETLPRPGGHARLHRRLSVAAISHQGAKRIPELRGQPTASFLGPELTPANEAAVTSLTDR